MVQARREIKVNLSKVASLLDGTLHGADAEVSDICVPENQKEDALCIISVKGYASYAKDGVAAAYIVSEGIELDTDKPYIIVQDARPALVKILNALYPPKDVKHSISKFAAISKKAEICKPVHIGNFVSVGDNTVIGKNTFIGAGTVIGDNVTIGENSVIYANVTIYDNVTIGNNVIIHGGAVIGADGFGFIPGENPVKIPQKGTVNICDFVEIGANSCVDRATIGATEIGFGTKIDNLVMVGHNTRLGKACLIASQVGFSGSIETGDFIVAGGQAGFADHIKIESGAVFGGQSGIPNDIKKKGMYLGSPCVEFGRFAKANAVFLELPELKRRVRNLEKQSSGN